MMPQDKQLTIENAKKYTSLNPFARLGVHCFLTQILQLINTLSPDNILDAGCGEGSVMRYIQTHQTRPYAITGIDMDYRRLLLAKGMQPKQDPIWASIEKMPFQDKAFDLVLCLETLEHLAAIDTALAELKRITKKNCIISLPLEPYFSICRFLGGKDISRLGKHPDHISCFNIAGVKKRLGCYFELRKTTFSFPWVIFWLGAK